MKRAIQFGAGNIGRGFIGAVLSEAGYHVVFADVNMEVIDRINKDGAYTVHIMDVESRDVRISNISGVDSGGGEIVDEIVRAEIITTAVGLRILPFIAPARTASVPPRSSGRRFTSISRPRRPHGATRTSGSPTVRSTASCLLCAARTRSTWSWRISTSGTSRRSRSWAVHRISRG